MLYSDDTLTTVETANNINGLTQEQKQQVMDFLRGVVYVWRNTHGEKPFTNRDLTADDWRGTPLMLVYNNRYEGYKKSYPNHTDQEHREWAYDQAPKDMGHLLKQVLIDDECYTFIKVDRYTSTYRLIKSENQ